MHLPMLLPHASTETYLPLLGNQYLSQENLLAVGGDPGVNSNYVSSPTTFAPLGQMDLANERLGNRAGPRNETGSGMPASILEPPCMDVFFSFQLTDSNSVNQLIHDRRSETCAPYSFPNGFEQAGDDCLEVLGRKSQKWRMIPLLDEDQPRVGHSFESEDEGRLAPPEQDLEAMEMDEIGQSHTGKPDSVPKTEEIKYVPPPHGPELTEDMIRENNAALTDGLGTDFIRELGGTRLTRNDLTNLKPSEWLEDPIIDFYFQMIKERNNRPEPEGDYPRVYVFPSTFYALLGSSRGLDKVRESVNDDNIFNYDMLLIPVCRSLHWRLLVVNVRQRSICSYNSLKTADLQIRKNIDRFLISEEERLFGRNQNRQPWFLTEGQAPQQTNVDDCGVFVLQFANYLSKRQAFNFSQQNMNYFRQTVLYELRYGRFL